MPTTSALLFSGKQGDDFYFYFLGYFFVAWIFPVFRATFFCRCVGLSLRRQPLNQPKMAEENNLGNLNATVSLTPDTTAVERAIADMTSKAKRQFDELGGQTLTQLTQNFNGLTNAVTGGLDAINSGIAKIRNVASLGFLGGGVAGIVKQIFQTRSYFQDAASSMKTFLGDADKAAKFTKELQEYAFYNMYEFQDLVGVSKQLIAYGTKDTKEIIQVTDQLSNIASGTGANIYEMVDIFNKIKARGTADGQVLQQLASRGLVVKDVLQQMGETVSGNKITFEQFQKVLAHVTGEGGMFHDLMKDQLNNLSASAAQLSDVMTNMWNEIGEQAEPYMKEAIDLAAMVVENYKEVAAVLFEIAKAYGIYKVATKAQEWNKESVAQDNAARYEREKAALEELTKAKEDDKNADLKARVAKGTLTEEQAKEIAMIRQAIEKREEELNKTKAQADAEVKATQQKIAANEKEISTIQTKIRQLQSLQSLSAKSGDMGAYKNQAAQIAELQAQEKQIAATNKETLAKQMETAAERSNNAAKELNTIQTGKNAAAEIANANATNLATRAKIAAQAALGGIKNAITSVINPTALATAAVGYLVTKLVELAMEESALEKEYGKLRQIESEYYENVRKEQATLDAVYGKTLKLKEGTAEYETAKTSIINQYKEYLSGLSAEETKLMTIEELYKKVTTAIKEKYKAQALEKAQDTFSQTVGDAKTSVLSELFKQLDKGTDEVMKASIKQRADKMFDDYIEATKKIREIQKVLPTIGGDPDEYQKKLAERNKIQDDFKKEYKDYYDYIKKYDLGDKITFGNPQWWQSATNSALDFIDIENAAAKVLKDAELMFQNNYVPPTVTTPTTPDPKPQAANLKKQKDLASAYVNEYAKIVADRAKKIREIDKKFDLTDEERTQALRRIDEQYNWDLNLARKKSGLDEARRTALEQSYSTAAAAEIEIARAQMQRVAAEIAKIENNRVDTSKKKKTVKEVNGEGKEITKEVDLTDAEKAGLVAAYDKQTADLAALNAELKGYQDAFDRYMAMEINYKRIAEITKSQNDKFLSEEVKKQQAITENYRKLRAEVEFLHKDGQLTEEQYNNLSFQLNANEERERQQEYINIYGGYYVKREQLVREWEQRLANVPPEYFNVAKQKMVEELSKMDFSQFKENLNWDAIFSDVSQQSAKAIKQNLDELKAAFSAEKGKMGIEEIKTVTEAIAKLDDELNKRNPWRAIASSIRTMNSVKDKLPELTEKHKKAQEELNKATVEYIRLKNELEELEERLNNPDLTAEQRAELETQYNDKLKEEGAALAVVTDKENAETNARKALNEETERGTKAQGAFAEGLKNIGGYLSQAGQAFSKLAGAMGESGEKLAMWGDTLSTLGDQASQIAQNWGNKGAMISQAISGTITMVSNVIASRKKAKQDEEAWAKAQRAVIENMKLARIEEERTKTKDNEAFGVRDYLSEVKDAVKAYGDAQNELYSKIQEMQEKGKAKKGQRDGIDWGTVGKNTATGAGVGAAIGSLVGPIGTAIGAAVGAISGFVSGLFSKKKKNIWGGLFDQYPELLEKGADGEERINTELAEQLIQQGILNDETKQMVEDAKAYQEEMDKAREQIEEIAESLLGSLGSNLQNALVDAFVAGEDAAEALHKTVESTLEDMIKNLLYGARLAPILQKIKEQTADVLANGGGAVDVMNVIKENYADLTTASQQFYDDIGYMKEEAAKSGFDIFSGEAAQRNAVSGGIANVTQDTAEEMNGRLTQIQSHTYAINENMRLMVNMQTTQLAILQGIHTDTGQLHAIRASIANLESTVSDIQIRGVKLKQ